MSESQWQDYGSTSRTIRRRMRIDPETSGLIIESSQECTEILAFNQALLNADRASSSLWGGNGYVRVARVPLILLEAWAKEGLAIWNKDPDVQAKIAKRLSDHHYAQLRTAPGRLG